MNVKLQEKEEFFTSLPLFQSLTLIDLDDIMLFAKPFSVEANTMLFRQGEVAEGIYFIRDGQVRLYADVPGNDLLELGTVASNDTIGEISLMDGGTPFAYAVALKPTSGYFLSNLEFEMLRVSLKTPALKIMNCLRGKICHSIRERISQVADTISVGETTTISNSEEQQEKQQTQTATSPSTLDRASLRSIPFFQMFSPSELEDFLAPMRRWDLPRGQILYKEGSPADSCFVTVRGAVRTNISRHLKHEHLVVYGPGRIVGALPLIDGSTRPTDCAVREQTILLEMDRAYFESLYRGDKEIGFKFLQVLNKELATDLRKLIWQMTRLASQGVALHL
jgi:CRP-like cAMP-binding protein